MTSAHEFEVVQIADRRARTASPSLAHYLRLRAAGTAQQAADFIADEIGRPNGATPCRQTIEALDAIFSRPVRDATIELGSYLREICSAMRPLACADGTVELACDCDPACECHKADAVPIGLIVGETILNATNHAHPARVSGRIDVGCRRTGTDLFIEVADDGVGLPVNFDAAKGGGLGFEMVRALAKQLGATTSFESGPLGLRFLLKLKN